MKDHKKRRSHSIMVQYNVVLGPLRIPMQLRLDVILPGHKLQLRVQEPAYAELFDQRDMVFPYLLMGRGEDAVFHRVVLREDIDHVIAGVRNCARTRIHDRFQLLDGSLDIAWVQRGDVRERPANVGATQESWIVQAREG